MPGALRNRKLGLVPTVGGLWGLTFWLVGLIGSLGSDVAEAAVQPFDPRRMLPDVYDSKTCNEFKTLGRIKAIGPAAAHYFHATFDVHTRHGSSVGLEFAADSVGQIGDSCSRQQPMRVS